MKPRTEKEIESWYQKTGNDPWDYNSPFVQYRLDRSIKFLRRHIPANFQGLFLEIGSFNGMFTERLCGTYPNSSIVAVDISNTALQIAHERLKSFDNIFYLKSDVIHLKKLDVDRHCKVDSNATLILLMEVLYYLREHERAEVIDHLNSEFPFSQIIFSSPINGIGYFSEDAMFDLFGKDYICIDKMVLNLRTGWLQKIHFLEHQLRRMSAKWAPLRRLLAHQVIYFFQPKPKPPQTILSKNKF